MPKTLEKYNKWLALQNTLSLRDKKGVFCMYNNVDWLDIRVSDLNPVLDVFRGLSVNSSSIAFPFGGFVAEYRWMINWDSQILVDILDLNSKKVWQLTFKVQTSVVRKNKNYPTKLGFDWVFFTFYFDYFDSFLEYFWISRTQQNIILRLDYCVDLCGVYVDDLYKKYRALPKTRCLSKPKPKYEDPITWKVTGYTYETDTNDIQIYDKKLDIVVKWKYLLKNEFWDCPWQAYKDCVSPISRIEVRWNSHSWYQKKHADINYVFDNWLQLFIEYVKNFYQLDLEPFFQDYQKKAIKIKRDVVNDPIIEHKKTFALRMFRAYAKSCASLFSFEEVQEEFYSCFEFQNVFQEPSFFENLSSVKEYKRKQYARSNRVYFPNVRRSSDYSFEYEDEEKEND